MVAANYHGEMTTDATGVAYQRVRMMETLEHLVLILYTRKYPGFSPLGGVKC
jgi:hypothetical protein